MYQVKQDDLTGEQPRALLALHLAGMRAASPPEEVFALDLSGLLAPDITVWSAWAGERIAAIGALRMLGGGHAEIKSMRAHPDYAGKGAGRAILDTIIAEARRRGIHRLSVETGTGAAFEAAHALYLRHGFVEGGAFADYAVSPFSRFYHLALR